MAQKTRRILFTGGGTLGSVTTLLAIAPFVQKAGYEVLWIGTKNGPERAFVENAGIHFTAITAPKFRRYLSWRHLLLPYELVKGCVQALRYVIDHRPDAIVSAGGFVSVPVVWMGWVRKVPSLVHQQDRQLGLANFLMMPCAERFTVTFEESAKHFPSAKTVRTGNPVRDLVPTTHAIVVDDHVPTVLIFGGGTGAQGINALVTADLCDFANVIHVTGKGKAGNTTFRHARYFSYELLGEEMKEALHVADVVVCRAGLGTITELAALKKPAMVIPLPGTHQEKNAEVLRVRDAAVVRDQAALTPALFTTEVRSLVQDKQRQKIVAEHIGKLHSPHAAQDIAKEIIILAKGGGR